MEAEPEVDAVVELLVCVAVAEAEEVAQQGQAAQVVVWVAAGEHRFPQLVAVEAGLVAVEAGLVGLVAAHLQPAVGVLQHLCQCTFLVSLLRARLEDSGQTLTMSLKTLLYYVENALSAAFGGGGETNETCALKMNKQ